MRSRRKTGCKYKAALESELGIELDQLRKDAAMLTGIAGMRKHQEFAALKKRCEADHDSITEIKREIGLHCSEHGC
jgi:hypothetical protein